MNAFYDNGPGEQELANFIETTFKREGFRVERQMAISATETSAARENVLIHLRGRDSSRRLLLEAHMGAIKGTEVVSVLELANVHELLSPEGRHKSSR